MKQTTLDLNGPILSFSSNPVGLTTSTGTATLSGVATVSFPTQTPENPAVPTGSISYRWYEVGVGPLSDGPNVTGSGTTVLTLLNLVSPDDNGREFYLQADYVPSAYGLPGVAVTVGSARSTGNALNEPLNSGIGTIFVNPFIEIIAQPSNRTTSLNTNATISVVAGLSDNSYTSPLNYQWYLNGVAIDDGNVVIPTTTSTTTTTTRNVSYFSDTTLDLPATTTNVTITIAGASGGTGGTDAGGSGGGGASGRVGKFTYADGERRLDFKIGRRGNDGTSGNFSAFGSGGSSPVAAGGRGGGAGGSGWSGGGGGGGGASGIIENGNFLTVVAAGGGGGGGASLGRSGSGGSAGGNFSGTTSTIGTSSGSQGGDKSGDGAGGGGGGGGSFGGGGGGSGQDNSSGGGGGAGGGSRYRTDRATLLQEFGQNGDGYVNIEYTTSRVDIVSADGNISVSGTKTPILTLNSDFAGIQTAQCRISNSSATNSPVFSNVVTFVSLSTAEQYNIVSESIGITTNSNISSANLFNGDYEFVASSGDATSGRNTEFFSIYSPDRDIIVEMDLYGGRGSDFGSYLGGEGGFSRISFTMERNVEYVIAGLTTSINTPYIYRKGALIACVGSGGNAGSSGNGGSGGGINVAGSDGFGRNAGIGGAVILPSTLGSDGIFGSLTTLTATAPDTKATAPNGGRTIKCSKGIYWRQQGISACSDVGTTKFRLSDGTIVPDTASIQRGFKAGYSIIQTAGQGTSGGGHGGNGATGGNGGTLGGGGGGSGYTDSSITVISTQLGGSTERNAKVVLRISQ